MEKTSRKKVEEEKIRLEEAYEEFRETFEDGVVKVSKTFIRGDVVNPDKSEITAPKQSIYKPAPVIQIKSQNLEVAKKLAQETARKIMGGIDTTTATTTKQPPHKIRHHHHHPEGDEGQQQQQKAIPSTKRPPKPGTTKIEKSKLTNLEAFKEELKQMQAMRDERKGLRQHLKDKLGVPEEEINLIAPTLDTPYLGAGIQGNVDFENDPTTTNLYVCNLPPDTKLEDFFETFGTFGPLASAKILFPKPDEERYRSTLSGFVAFMSRIDAERALSAMNGEFIRDCDLRVSWARPVVIPPMPFYVPPPLRELAMPDPPSGLPFNAKPISEELRIFLQKYHDLPKLNAPLDISDRKMYGDYKKMVENSTVRVVIPTERPLLQLIHRAVEFLVRSGPLFEAILMARERQNPMYRFLFDNHHPTHVYYRWRLYSILQGDDRTQWRLDKFKMFEGGSWWQPPPHALFELGMPPQLYDTAFAPKKRHLYGKKGRLRERNRSRERSFGETTNEGGGGGGDEEHERLRQRRHALRTDVEREERRKRLRGTLDDQSREEFENLLRNLTPEKVTIGDSMVWCLDHAECSKEITQCIFESLCIKETPLHKKIARIYLVSDILANCAVRVKDAFYFRQHFSEYLMKIFVELNETLESIESRLKAEQFRQRVMLCFRNWEDHAVYPTKDLIKWQNIFLGLLKSDTEMGATIEGEEITQKDLDGIPIPEDIDEDIDGMPILDEGEYNNDLDGMPMSDAESSTNRFTTESWSMVEPPSQQEIDASNKQSNVTHSKWESVGSSRWEQPQTEEVARRSDSKSTTEKPEQTRTSVRRVEKNHYEAEKEKGHHSKRSKPEPAVDDIRNTKDTCEEERRKMLREIEMKVMKLQDELEADEANVSQTKIDAELAKYRKKLVQKMEDKLNNTRRTATSTVEKKSSSTREETARNGKRRFSRERGSRRY